MMIKKYFQIQQKKKKDKNIVIKMKNLLNLMVKNFLFKLINIMKNLEVNKMIIMLYMKMEK